jgi:hypothetical protein
VLSSLVQRLAATVAISARPAADRIGPRSNSGRFGYLMDCRARADHRRVFKLVIKIPTYYEGVAKIE